MYRLGSRVLLLLPSQPVSGFGRTTHNILGGNQRIIPLETAFSHEITSLPGPKFASTAPVLLETLLHTIILWHIVQQNLYYGLIMNSW